jgi:hypothetical protein
MTTANKLRNTERLFVGIDRQLSLDPRRWARVFRHMTDKKAKLYPMPAGRKTVRNIKANNARRAAMTFGGTL